MPRQRARDKALETRRPCRQRGTCQPRGAEGRENAGAGPGDPRERRMLSKRCQRDGDVRMACRRDRLQIIPAITLGKDVYFR